MTHATGHLQTGNIKRKLAKQDNQNANNKTL